MKVPWFQWHCRDGGAAARNVRAGLGKNQVRISLLLTSIVPPLKDCTCLRYPEAPCKALAQQSADSILSAVASLSPQERRRIGGGQDKPAAQRSQGRQAVTLHTMHSTEPCTRAGSCHSDLAGDEG